MEEEFVCGYVYVCVDIFMGMGGAGVYEWLGVWVTVGCENVWCILGVHVVMCVH